MSELELSAAEEWTDGGFWRDLKRSLDTPPRVWLSRQDLLRTHERCIVGTGQVIGFFRSSDRAPHENDGGRGAGAP